MAPVRSAVFRLASEYARTRARRAAAKVALLIVAFVLVLIALGFAIGGIYSAIEAPLGPVAASFIMAGGALLIAIAFIVAANRPGRSRREDRQTIFDEVAEEHPRAAGLGDIVAAFGVGLIQGLTKRRKP